MPGPHELTVHALLTACREGDLGALRAVLHAGAVAVCDGAGLVPVHGAGDVALLVTALLGGLPVMPAAVNGQAGLLLRRAGVVVTVVAVTTESGLIAALWIIVDPARLASWNRGPLSGGGRAGAA
jgi:hypothetical protein